MRVAYKARIEKRLVMTYSPILGTTYEIRNVLIEEENHIREIINNK